MNLKLQKQARARAPPLLCETDARLRNRSFHGPQICSKQCGSDDAVVRQHAYVGWPSVEQPHYMSPPHVENACQKGKHPSMDSDQDFPYPAVSRILWHLTGKDFGRAVCLSRKWRDVGNSESRHWKRLCMHTYPLYSSVSGDQEWRELYLHEQDVRFGEVLPVRLDFQATTIKLHNSKAAASHQSVITLWDLEACTQISRIIAETGVTCIDLDNNWVAAGLDNNEIKIWEHTSEIPIHSLNTGKKKPKNSVNCVGFNKSILVMGSLDCIRVWSIETWDCIHTLQVGDIHCLELMHRTLVLGSRQSLMVWDLDSQVTKSTLCDTEGALTCVKYWPETEKVGVGVCGRWQNTGRVGIFGLNQGPWFPDCTFFEGDGTGVLGLDNDATKLVTGGVDRKIRVWDLETQECVRTIADQVGDYVLAIQIRGSRIVCGSNQGISVLKFKVR
ncbi:hypothetical protein BSKO_09320 [Bryopsis sp. KO-2023]|nr:hypothetical protein BSKO_09320 [Bryopsis sp. KO-2023]